MERKKSKTFFKILTVAVMHILVIIASLCVCHAVHKKQQINAFCFEELSDWEKEHLVSEKVVYELTYKFDGYDDYTVTGENNYYYNGKNFVNYLDMVEN